jgi:hypothetical protein
LLAHLMFGGPDDGDRIGARWARLDSWRSPGRSVGRSPGRKTGRSPERSAGSEPRAERRAEPTVELRAEPRAEARAAPCWPIDGPTACQSLALHGAHPVDTVDPPMGCLHRDQQNCPVHYRAKVVMAQFHVR